jgi:hypothetical protein
MTKTNIVKAVEMTEEELPTIAGGLIARAWPSDPIHPSDPMWPGDPHFPVDPMFPIFSRFLI